MSQPTLRWEGDAKARGCVFQGRMTDEVVTNVYLWKTLEKPNVGLRILSVKGSGVVFTHGEGISTPNVRHTGRQRLMLFSLFMFF